MKLRTKYLVMLCLLLLVSSVPFQTSAHPAGALCQAGSEMLGWRVDCSNHQAAPSFKWYTPIADSPTAVDYRYRMAANAGASKWKDTVTITNSTSSTNSGYIYTFNDSNTSILGVFHDYSSNGQGHLISWKIKFNKTALDTFTVAQVAVIAAHEFGHAIGMYDLYQIGNNDKLMYAYWPYTTVSPTAKDILGAKEATRN